MIRHYTTRRGVGLAEVLSCGDDFEAVVRAALAIERHPVVVEVLPGATCPRCGWSAARAAHAGGSNHA